MSKNNLFQFSSIVVLLFATILLSILSFSHKVSSPTIIVKATATPEVKFFITSFESTSSQANSSLKSIYDMFQDSVTFSPHFFFEKVSSSEQLLHPKNYLKTSNGSSYGSPHGRQEANQNIREICALQQTTNHQEIWWKFVDNVNKNCTPNNADICWEDQAKSAGLNTVKIIDCFNTDAVAIIENEITAARIFSVSSSPTIFINDIIFSNDRLNLNIDNLKTIICDSMNQKIKACH